MLATALPVPALLHAARACTQCEDRSDMGARWAVFLTELFAIVALWYFITAPAATYLDNLDLTLAFLQACSHCTASTPAPALCPCPAPRSRSPSLVLACPLAMTYLNLTPVFSEPLTTDR